MARSTKNTALVAGIESEIGKLSDTIPENVLAVLEESKSKALHIVAIMVTEYRKAELTEEQAQELAEANSRLADIGATEEQAQSDLLVKWRAEEDKRMAKAPKKEHGKILLAVNSERAQALDNLLTTFEQKRADDNAVVAKLSNVKGETAKSKGLEYLGHTFGESASNTIRPPIQGNAWLMTDILTKSKLSCVGYLTEDGVYWIYPIGEDWRKPLAPPFALSPDMWHSVGVLPTAKLSSATDVQAIHYRAIDHMSERKSLADLHSYIVGLTENGNLQLESGKKINIGGSRGVTHIVKELANPGFVRQQVYSEFCKQYQWEEPTEEPA